MKHETFALESVETIELETIIPTNVYVHDHFRLDENKKAIPCTLEEFAEQYEQLSKEHKKHVGLDELQNHMVSTVWLGLNHNFLPGEPLLFETMVFDEDGDDIYCVRYSTWQEAEIGHSEAVQWVKDGCIKDD